MSGGCDNMIKTWRHDANENRWFEVAKLEGHSDWVRDVAWAPSVGSERSVIASCSQVGHNKSIETLDTIDSPTSFRIAESSSGRVRLVMAPVPGHPRP